MFTNAMEVLWLNAFYFSYYGLLVWFPDMIKHLQNEEYESKVKIFHKERIKNFVFNFPLENQIHKDGEYISNKYVKQMKL